MRIQLNTKRLQRLRNSLLFLSFFLLCQAAFAQNNNDPDMPDFAKYKLNKEEFRLLIDDLELVLKGLFGSDVVVATTSESVLEF